MIFDLILLLVTLPLVLWAGWLLAVVLAGAVVPDRRIGCRGPRAIGPAGPTLAVLVPAHDEEAGIGDTLDSVLAQLAPGDRVLVVADNCSDGTAKAAAARVEAAGPGVSGEVIERRDEVRRGKPWALAAGLDRLAAHPPDAVLVLDADCMLGPGAVDALRGQVGRFGRAVQALYLLELPSQAGPRERLSAFAFTVKNRTRLRGTSVLGLPSHLLGTGMLIPWEDTATMRAGSNDLAEDMSLGAHLAAAGRGAMLVEAAIVRSPAASGESATHGQRTRWERGHLEAIRTEVPKLLVAAIRRRDVRTLAFALDLSVPPLALLVALLVAATLVGGAAGAFGAAGWGSGLAASGGLLAVGAAVLLAMATTARGHVRPMDLMRVPWYVAWKLPIYAGFLLRRRIGWRRTDREVPAAAAGLGPSSEGSR